MERYISAAAPAAVALVCTVIVLHFLIPVLRKRKMGQKILDIGPGWHKDKEGTPTMGGMSFVVSLGFSVVFSLLLVVGDVTADVDRALYFTASYAVLSALIGVTDDLCKLRNRRNEGLTPSEKYVLQLLLATVFVIFLRRFGIVDTALSLPFTDKRMELGAFYYVFALLFLTGFGNAVNLTDGLDGLCAGVTSGVMLFFLADGIKRGEQGETLFSAAVFGICLGFLVYNVHPAKVFMGDTGSLFLGAAVSGIALVTDNAPILFIVGVVYLLEAVSVILQVLWFKATGKRLFLMAPLHHHFEKKGRSENVITVFSVTLTALLSLVCFVFG